MKPEQRGALVLVGSAIALGVAADVLFYGRPLGVNVVAFALVLVAGLALFLRATKAPLHQGRRWMTAPLAIFAALFAWHDSGLLRVANALALVGAVALGALRRSQPKPHEATVVDYAATLALNAVNPDAVIARTNLDRPKVDPAYLAQLSDDAVPTLVARVPSIRNPALRTSLAGALLDRRFDRDLLGWNASRSAARAAVEAHRAELAYLAGR